MKLLKLTRGVEVKVDDEAHSILHYYNWTAHDTKNLNWFYASRQCKVDGVMVRVWLHKLLADAPGGWLVKQINNDRYDYRSENLIAVSLKKKEYKVRSFNGKTLLLGVRWCPYYGMWESFLDKLHVGYHRTTIEAARAYNDALRHIKEMSFETNKGLPMYRHEGRHRDPYFEGAVPVD